MKPKTKLQKEVWDLYAKSLKPIKYQKHMIGKHDTFFTTHYNSLVCLECGNIWRGEFDKNTIISVLNKPVCPSCKKKLNNYKDKINGYYHSEYLTFCQAKYHDRFMIFKYFSCEKRFRKGKKADYYIRSLFEEWIDVKTLKSTFIGRTSSLSYYSGDGFSNGDYEIRDVRSRMNYDGSYHIMINYTSHFNLPNARIHPKFNRYKLKPPFYNCDLRSLFKEVISRPMVETIYKAGYGSLLFHSIHNNFSLKKFWPQVKIAMRNNYPIDDPTMWKDYLNFLEYFSKDLRNPKFILPDNLKKAHNDLMEMKRIKEEKEIERERIKKEKEERLIAETDQAIKDVKNELFKDLRFDGGEIYIIPLLEDEDVKNEGLILRHCVYESDYHKKKGILLMSARKGDERIATIEISLSNYSIIQIRGYDNQDTEYNPFIELLLKNNMSKISRLVEREKKKKYLLKGELIEV